MIICDYTKLFLCVVAVERIVPTFFLIDFLNIYPLFYVSSCGSFLVRV